MCSSGNDTLLPIEHAVSTCIEDEVPSTDWETVVLESHVQQSKLIVDYIIEQKFALMKPEVIIPVCSQIDNEEDGSFDAIQV